MNIPQIYKYFAPPQRRDPTYIETNSLRSQAYPMIRARKGLKCSRLRRATILTEIHFDLDSKMYVK